VGLRLSLSLGLSAAHEPELIPKLPQEPRSEPYLVDAFRCLGDPHSFQVVGVQFDEIGTSSVGGLLLHASYDLGGVGATRDRNRTP
jgi:hypothetical protein